MAARPNIGCEVVTFTADLGQGEELEPARQKALMLGIKPENIHIVDVREEFVRDFVFPMFRANALYEGLYLLGTSIARPLISQHLVRIAHETGADAVAHGATGKGNDQVRFELSAYALDPSIRVIAPWREWDLTSRTRCWNSPRRTRSRSPRTSGARRRFRWTRTCCTPRPRGRCWKTRATSRARICLQRTVDPEAAPDAPRDGGDHLRARRCGGGQRRGTEPRDAADAAERAGRKHGVGGWIWSRTASSA
jgi:argininosuccinate synthase